MLWSSSRPCRRCAIALGLCMMLSIARSAHAGTVRFDVSDPQIDHDGDITLTINGKPYKVSVTAGMNAGRKADAIAAQLGSPSVGFTVDHKTGSPTVKLPQMPDSNTVTFDPGKTGEQKDSIKISGAVIADAGAVIQFHNPQFDRLDYLGHFAVFTAGFSTDFGDLAYSIDSQSLPDTSGTTIAQALFALLEPQASSYGIDLSINGDTLDARFGSSAVQSGGAGVIFGTSAESDGLLASLTVSSVPEPSALTLALLGVAALGLVGYAQRLRKKAPSPAC